MQTLLWTEKVPSWNEEPSGFDGKINQWMPQVGQPEEALDWTEQVSGWTEETADWILDDSGWTEEAHGQTKKKAPSWIEEATA